VPSSTIFAPGRGCPSASVTVPETCVCAHIIVDANTTISVSSFFIFKLGFNKTLSGKDTI
jgi:hypothetical protein